MASGDFAKVGYLLQAAHWGFALSCIPTNTFMSTPRQLRSGTNRRDITIAEQEDLTQLVETSRK